MAKTGSRQATMEIDLGGEQVLLERIDCVEELGQPFSLKVQIIAALGEIDILPHLGKPVALSIYEDDQFLRYFHGLVTEAEFVKESASGFHYRLLARPFTYYLDHTRNMAIFQDKSVRVIIQDVLDRAGVADYDFARLTRSYVDRPYCVQYRESDWAFITRLMEEEGIYYFFEHVANRHTIVFCDAPSSHRQGVPASLVYNPSAQTVFAAGSAERTGRQEQYLNTLSERIESGGQARVTLRDFDFEKPERPLQGTADAKNLHPNDNREVYDYPGHFVAESVGTDRGKARLGALRRFRQVYTGETQAASLGCGTTVSVAQHHTDRFNADYLITQTRHSIVSETYRSGNDADEEIYNVRFQAIPAGTAFNLLNVTPRPVVQGLETAVVSGPDGEEIYTDEYGRVKVRFHWDRADTTGEKSTCWIRVAQFGNLGSLILPRVGQEVMVDFLHGDPDHPIVMGWVFNKTHMPIYDLPANKTRALWRTKRYGETGSYPNAQALDTGAPGVNELRFEDKGGAEEVFLHAERDMNTRVRFAETHHVGQNQQQKVGYDRTASVGNDETTTIGKNQTLTVTGDQTETNKAKRAVEVKATDALKIGQSQTVEAGTTIEVSANTSITLKVGASSIKIDSTGVTIKGMMVKVEGTSTVGIKSMVTQVEGGGTAILKGAVVMIN